MLAPPANNLLVVCLCAAWCTTCIEVPAEIARLPEALRERLAGGKFG